MWTISNDKKVDDGEVICLPVEYNVKKPQTILDSGLVLEQSHCMVKTSLGSPKKCNDNENDDFKVKYLSVKSDVGKPQRISRIDNKMGQLRFRAGASLGRSKNHNPLRQMNRTRSECRFNVNIFSDDRRNNEYGNSGRKSRPLEKTPLRPKRPITDEVGDDLQRVHRLENDTGERHRPSYKLQEWTGPQFDASYDYKQDYYDDETGWQQHRNMQNYNWNEQQTNLKTYRQQAYPDFMSYVDEFSLLDGEQPEENMLTVRQEEQPSRREERKSRRKERYQRQDDRQLTNMRRTEDELARVKIQRLHLLRCIEHHQRALTEETQQLLKNQQKQQRLRRDNENERLEEIRWLMCSQCSQQENDTTQQERQGEMRGQHDSVSFDSAYNESTPQSYSRNKPAQEKFLIDSRKPQQPVNSANKNSNKQQLRHVHRHTAARPKVSKPYVSPPQSDSVSINTFDDCLTSATFTSTSTNGIRGRAGVDDISSLPPQHKIQCNCVIDVPNDMEQWIKVPIPVVTGPILPQIKRSRENDIQNDVGQCIAGSKPGAIIETDDHYRQSRSRTGRNRTMDTNISVGCAPRPTSPRSRSQRSQLYCRNCTAWNK